MTWINQDKTAIVGIGATPYYIRNQSCPRTINELAGDAVLAACRDAGLSVRQLDGFALFMGGQAGYSDKLNVPSLMEMLGMEEVGFMGALTGGGGGSAGTPGLATAAIVNGDATYVVTVLSLQQARQRLGTVAISAPATPESSFVQPSGMVGAGHLFAPMVRRHMHLYGTRREAFGEIVVSQRANAVNRPTAIRRTPLTIEEYFQSPMLADPLCRLDFCMENDGAIAFITTTTERAEDLKQQPVYIHGCVHGGSRAWGRAFDWHNMPAEDYASSGSRSVAGRLWAMSGVGPEDMDVALIYDHFSPLVLMQLEDFGFCRKGEGGAFVESGAIRYGTGSIPVNTHGGQLSECYLIGMTHIYEAVEQLRGNAINQVDDAEFALVTGGPGPLPMSGLVLRR